MDLPQKPKKIVPEINEKSKAIYNSFSKNVKDFYNFHGVQMMGSLFPMSLVETLYNKLSTATSDVGQYFEIVEDEENGTFELRAKKDIPAEGNVFIVDHALTFRYPDLRKLLSENTSLIPRLNEMLKYHREPWKLPGQKEQEKVIESAENFAQIELDNMQLEDLSHLDIPKNTVTLSLIENHLASEEDLIKKIQYLNLRILWLNGNPIEESQTIVDYVKNKTKIEMFNSKFTENCTEWTIKYVQKKGLKFACHQSPKNIKRLNLDDRDIFVVNDIVGLLGKFENLVELSIKGHEISEEKHRNIIKQILEQCKNLKVLKVDLDAELTIFEMFKSEQISKQIAKRVLINYHSLFCAEPTQTDIDIDEIERDLFKISGCYRLASTQQLDETSIWYVNDQVGTSIQHSDTPNVKMIPFLFSEDNKLGQNMWAYSIFWPLSEIKAGQPVFRDYLHGYPEEKQRSSRLAIWFDVPWAFFRNRFQKLDKNMKTLEKDSVKIIANFYKENTEKQREQIHKLSQNRELYPESRKMVTDNQSIIDNLTHKQIQLIKTMEGADIIWLTGALDEETWPVYKDKYYINQFPFEASVVLKHNLAETVQSVLGNTPFLMRTYDLEKQLPEFIGEYHQRHEKGEDNFWILKPPNMARSMDMVITNNLSTIIKNMETGPKIAQKYISNPVLRQGRKIDLRYILLVKSVNPLTMFLYKHFWVRSSNNPYTLDCRYLSTYETQFTVMNYGQVSDFKQIKYTDFIEEFEKDYSYKWSEVHEKIKKMLRNTFIAASTKYPQMHNEKSRAMYGIDVMIDEETMEPKLLEITFSPDCKRACTYYPSFFNEVAETLFLDIIGENMERVI